MKKWGIHLCGPWEEEYDLGAPVRLYIKTPWRFWMIGQKSQVYTKREGYTDRWSYITYRPHKD